MPNIGPMELVVVLVIALVVLGPKRLPAAGRSLGQGIREFRQSITGKGGDDAGAGGRGAGAAPPGAKRPPGPVRSPVGGTRPPRGRPCLKVAAPPVPAPRAAESLLGAPHGRSGPRWKRCLRRHVQMHELR